MYSVLIQDPRTLELFQRYYPIFTDALSADRIGVCPWNVNGTDVDAMVPGLYGCVDGKEEWQAVIVRADVQNTTWPTVPENPYDFLENRETENSGSEDAQSDAPGEDGDTPKIRESRIPLIRLTHMLSGVPAPEIRFEEVTVQEAGRMQRTVYESRVDQKEQDEWKALNRKYHFDAVPPTKVILVTLCIRESSASSDIVNAWRQNREADSSVFWKRNGYPNNCRFISYEAENRGKTKWTEELFRFWMSVMLLATNEIDSDVMQAYRLYRVNVDFDEEQMLRTMQASADRAKSVRYFLARRLERLLEEQKRELNEVPEYETNISVEIQNPDGSGIASEVESDLFPLTSEGHDSELKTWDNAHSDAKKDLDSMNLAAVRALDRASDDVKTKSVFDPEDVLLLGRYQMEDLSAGLEEIHSDIYEQRRILPDGSREEKKRLDEQSGKIQLRIVQRVTSAVAWVTTLLAALLILTSLVPSLFLIPESAGDCRGNVGFAALAAAVLVGLCALIALAVQHLKLKGEIDRYNDILSEAINTIARNARQFSEYMSSVASYMRGGSYLSAAKRKAATRDGAQKQIRGHIDAMDTFLADLRNWCFAFHLDVDFSFSDVNKAQAIDMEISPFLNPLYTFETGNSYERPVNRSGSYVVTPFGFVKQLTITREELYDD